MCKTKTLNASNYSRKTGNVQILLKGAFKKLCKPIALC